MNDLNLDGLLDIKLEIPQLATVVKAKTTVKNPEDADIRVFARGTVLPSAALVAEFDLEFQPKGKPKGNAIDVFSSVDWPMITLEKEMIFVAVVRKTNPKVDLFNKVTYTENTPNVSVMDSPNATFGKHVLLEMLTSAYGVDWETTKYVDLTIARSNKMESPSDKFWIPKTVSRGAHKGDFAIVVRENAAVFPLVIKHEERIEDVTSTFGNEEALVEDNFIPVVGDVVEEVEEESVMDSGLPTSQGDALDPFKLG